MMAIFFLAIAQIKTQAQTNNYNMSGSNHALLNPYAKFDTVYKDNAMYHNNSMQYNRDNNQNTATFPGNGNYTDPTRDNVNKANSGDNTTDMNTHNPASNGSNTNGYDNLNSQNGK